jgi:hypothetical protein
MALLESYWKFKTGVSLGLYEKDWSKGVHNLKNKFIKFIIDLKVGTRLKITWSNQNNLQHERTNYLQPLPHNF